MEKVTGIGGVFFKAKNPTELSKWYSEKLGIQMPPNTYDEKDWQQSSGPTVFAPMDADSTHFKHNAQLYINFRVNDLDAMCVQLKNNAVKVIVDPEEYPNGRFASLSDPEGNQIQLWEVHSDLRS